MKKVVIVTGSSTGIGRAIVQRVVAEGGRVRAWVNGEPGFDFTETEPGIAQKGRIGLQIHGGGKSMVEFKDLMVTQKPSK